MARPATRSGNDVPLCGAVTVTRTGGSSPADAVDTDRGKRQRQQAQPAAVSEQERPAPLASLTRAEHDVALQSPRV